MNKISDLPSCASCKIKSQDTCTEEGCRYWIDYGEDFNCSLVSIYTNGPMSLMEVAKRMNLSFVRISQIEKQAIAKMFKRIKK